MENRRKIVENRFQSYQRIAVELVKLDGLKITPKMARNRIKAAGVEGSMS